MNQHYIRGELLLEQNRFELAINELRMAVAVEPDEPAGHATLALALMRSGALREAMQEAQTALEKDPNDGYAHFIMALMRLERKEHKAAEESIREAMQLEPECAVHHGLLSRVLCEKKRFDEALRCADEGLAIDASDDLCLTYRARALMGLGRSPEASHAADRLLAEGPEDGWNHCIKGEQLLEQSDSAGARIHFLEALRIDPTNQAARDGLVTSLKARSVLYALALRVLIWLERFRAWAVWAGIIGIFVFLRFSDAWARQHPDWIVPLEGAKALFIGFWILLVIANPLFDLLLRFDPEGRHALSPDEMKATNWFIVCLAFGGVCLAWSCFGKSGTMRSGMAMASFLLCNSITHVFESTPGYVRKRMAVLTAVAGASIVLTPVVGVMGVLVVWAGLKQLGIRLLTLAFWMPIGAMVFAMFSENIRAWLENRRPDSDLGDR